MVTVNNAQQVVSASPPAATPALMRSASPRDFSDANKDPSPSCPMSSSTYSVLLRLYARRSKLGTVNTKSSCLPSRIMVVSMRKGSWFKYGAPAEAYEIAGSPSARMSPKTSATIFWSSSKVCSPNSVSDMRPAW